MSNNTQSSVDKEFVPYSEALSLKVLGFNEPCLGHYQDRDETTMHGAVATSKNVYFYIGETNKGFIVRNSPISNCVLAPTFSQAFRWFREKYSLYGWVSAHAIFGVITFYHYSIGYKQSDNEGQDYSSYKKYEEAELECLKKLIEIFKNK